MKRILLAACLLLTAGNLFAQVNYYRAKQQAVRDSNQNDAEQRRIQQAASEPAGAPASSGSTAAPSAPTDPALQATLNNVKSLQANFATLIQSSSDQPDPAVKAALMTNLSQAAQGTNKATVNAVKKLADDLMTAVAGKKKITAAQQKQLAGYCHAVFNGAHLTDANQQMIYNGVQKILTDGGASLDDAVNVVTDLKSVVAETK